MLTTDDLARLRGLLAQHKQLTAIKGTMEYLSAYCKWDAAAGKFLADHGEELARVYAAVLVAPEGMLAHYPEANDRATFLYFNGQGSVPVGREVRLVPLGAGKGED